MTAARLGHRTQWVKLLRSCKDRGAADVLPVRAVIDENERSLCARHRIGRNGRRVTIGGIESCRIAPGSRIVLHEQRERLTDKGGIRGYTPRHTTVLRPRLVAAISEIRDRSGAGISGRDRRYIVRRSPY